METKHFKGHLIADLARKAGVSRVYTQKLITSERAANTEVAKKIVKAVTIYETALEAAEKKVDRLFQQ